MTLHRLLSLYRRLRITWLRKQVARCEIALEELEARCGDCRVMREHWREAGDGLLEMTWDLRVMHLARHIAWHAGRKSLLSSEIARLERLVK